MDTIKVGGGCQAKAKVLSSIPFRGAFALAAGGYFLTRYLSMLDKVSSHFPRSPFTHPSSPTLARILSLSLRFFFFAVFVFSPRPLCFLSSFFSSASPGEFRCHVFRRSLQETTTSSDCQDEFYIFADSFIVAGLDDRVNKRQKVLSLRSRATCERTYRKNLARHLSPSLFISIDRWDRRGWSKSLNLIFDV